MLSHVVLKNFKAFENVLIRMGPLTLLSGVNGSGKSSVLQALAVLKQSEAGGCLTPMEGLLLNGEYVDLGAGRDVLFEHANSQEISIGILDSEDAIEKMWTFQYAEKDDMLQLINDQTKQSSFFPRRMQYLRADRISPAVMFPKSYSDVIRRRFLGVRGQYTVHFLAACQDELVSEKRRRPGTSSGSGLLEQVSAWLAEISPGVKVGSKEVTGADLAQLWFTFYGRAGLSSSNEYRPTNVGFGLTYSLPIITACLSAAPGDLLLLENPEAHLHPRGQTVMGELISATAADGVQVVFETHSEHVLNGVRLAAKKEIIDVNDINFHFFSQREDGRGSEVASPSVDKRGRLDVWPKGFFDEWERALVELI